ncbi:MAG: hypothetical protein LBM60_06335 [Clostridium sp.]|jgi:hypothetical protein|nr:hypothetical protein [Clostridium sp.]
MRKWMTLLLSVLMVFSLVACNPKELVQNAVSNALSGGTNDDGTTADANTDHGSNKPSNKPSNNSDATTDNGSNTPSNDPGATTGNTSQPTTSGSGWTLRIDEATVMDMMGLATVNYDCDLTATHVGDDMFGEYTGELAMEYSADLSGLQGLMQMAGMEMNYETDGWFKNTDFRIELTQYTAEDEEHFVDSLKDPTITDDERALTQSLLGGMLGSFGSGDKDFETSSTPVGLWYDWAFHMTEGDMSSYVNMTSAMFTASASQNETAQTAEGYADHIFTGSYHESLSYENESPFPYQIEVYESGEAVLTMRNANESPVVDKFYGTITKN